MNEVSFLYSNPAEKFFRKHEAVREKFKVRVLQLISRENPQQVHVKRLHGNMKEYDRIAIGNYRVLYEVINGEIIIVNVVAAGSRGDIYKKFRR